MKTISSRRLADALLSWGVRGARRPNDALQAGDALNDALNDAPGVLSNPTPEWTKESPPAQEIAL